MATEFVGGSSSGAYGKGGVEIDGVSEAIRALRKADAAASNEVRRIMRAETNEVRDQSRRRMMRRPFGGTYSRRPAQIRSVTNQRNASLKLMRSLYDHTAAGAELGSYVSTVFGRRVPNQALDRPHYAQYKGFPDRLDKGNSGTAMLPTIRKELPEWQRNTVDGALIVVTKLLRNEGVPTKTTGVA